MEKHLHSAYLEKIQELQNKLISLKEDYDELKFIICPNLQMLYMLKLGNLEYKAYQCETQLSYLRAKKELIQAAINRQEAINLIGIEEELAQRFAEYQHRLSNYLKDLNDSLERSQSPSLSIEELNELKHLYHLILKELHPDLHPNESKETIRLFHNAVDCYENGDLEGIRLIYSILQEEIPNLNRFKTLDSQQDEVCRLTKIISSLENSIRKIKSAFPYIHKTLLEDAVALSQKQNELTEYANQLTQQIKTLKIQIEELTKKNE